MSTTLAEPRSAPAEFFAGAGLLGRGLGLILRRPRLFWLGAVPGLVTSVLFTVILVILVSELKRIVGWLTPFTAGWGSLSAGFVQVVVGVGLLLGSILLMVLTFSTLTLTLGSPVYDKISESIDREFANPPAAGEESLVRGLGRSVRQSVALIAVSLLTAVVFLLVGLIPVVGSIVAAVGSASIGGWLLAIELLGSPMERRDRLAIRDRRAAMGRRRWRTLGLGVPTFLLLSIPFLAVVVFPAATAAGTLLARQLLDEDSRAR